ncbi:hypothetical protein LOZ39_006536 [Ophidiomyces ophidiicola]|nr:hypothetical protein LOZ49_006164 [Ophidiomyces ophidiicola]KAI2042120.1 hypothetical protein LOZ44_006364 [Ophidiomyces ophidiicola]KAI2066064.1 hypothetical protein LOZ39_006536 [Ophidiomyces ophidiicola]KAI2127830.1 hypothetical protein LOZ29_006573 [Ophidiomyces ophidiicola]KAI2129881.1 hypothetical protein LOZ28_006555 [Ophidiomyces ophidiicola]
MAPNRKKKPISNPARGFTTVSIPSKTKNINATEPVDGGRSTEAVVHKEPAAHLETDVNEVSESKTALKELSSEDLERHFEAAELQSILDKHGARCKSEASRQAGKLETERRTFRAQGTTFNLHEWLSPDIRTFILEKQTKDFKKLASYFNKRDERATNMVGEDDLCVDLWTLSQTLLKLGFPESKVNEALRCILMHYSNESIPLNQALEWLALHIAEDELPAYEQPKSMVRLDNQDAELESTFFCSGTSTPVLKPGKELEAFQADALSDSSDSYLDPDSLIPRYLELRSRIYALDPTFFNHSKPTTKKTVPSVADSATVDRKIGRLKKKLVVIENDILFDPEQADSQWKEILTDLRARTSQKLRQNVESLQTTRKLLHDENKGNLAINDHQGVTVSSALLESENEEEGILEAMFGAEPDSQTPITADTSETKSEVVKIRDFGKLPGLNPRRILEETCKTRDPEYKIAYLDVVSAPRSHRKSIEILWSKLQNPLPHFPLAGLSYNSNSRLTKISMVSLSASTALQAESYISVVALFLITASSQRENKAPIRLQGVWRDVWEELVNARKENEDIQDREAVKNIRNLLQQTKSLADEDIVLTENFKQRNGLGTPLSEKNLQYFNSPPSSEYYQALWTDRSSTAAYKQMQVTRMTLPIWQFKPQILETLEKNRTLIICSETGSGKSTQIPSFILENELLFGRSCKVYVTEPRRISAISLAKRVSEELGEGKDAIGTSRSLVGYSIRLESKISISTRLVFATTGVVIRMVERPQEFSEITHLVLDEVHERTLDTDFLLIILRRLLHQRSNLKLILMSATVDAKRFSTYLGGAPILDIPGRTFPVQTKYLEDAIEITKHYSHGESTDLTDESDSSSDEKSEPDEGLRSTLSGYNKQTRDAVCSFHEGRINYQLIMNLIFTIATKPNLIPFSNAMLVFMPGFAEIRKLHDLLLSDSFFGEGWIVHALHSSIATEDQEKAFLVPPKGIRKIVIATNIAETGITIPDVTAVLDTGKEKVMRFDERRQVSKLVEMFISRANAKQRRGRAGRVQQGICFHLFTKYRHDKLLAEQQTPEMLRLSLQDLILRVKICNLGDIEDTLSEAPDPPSSRNIRRAIEALKAVKALTGAEMLTPLGRQLAQLPLDVFLGKLILYGSVFRCVDAAVSIAAILSSKSPFVHTATSSVQTRAAKHAFQRGNSDLLSVYNAYRAWKKYRDTPGMNEFSFCRKNCLSPQALLSIEDVKTQLLVSLVDTGLVRLDASEQSSLKRARFSGRKRQFFIVPQRLDINSDNDLVVNSVIAWSFYPRLLTRQGKGWRNISNNQSVVLHSTSVNKTAGPVIKWLSYYHIMQSQNRNYNAHETSAVDEFSIALLCGDVEFKLYSGVISIDGSRIRLSVKDWKSMAALKALSTNMRDILAQKFRTPKKELTVDQKEWLDLWQLVFAQQKEKRDETAQRTNSRLF